MLQKWQLVLSFCNGLREKRQQIQQKQQKRQGFLCQICQSDAMLRCGGMESKGLAAPNPYDNPYRMPDYTIVTDVRGDRVTIWSDICFGYGLSSYFVLGCIAIIYAAKPIEITQLNQLIFVIAIPVVLAAIPALYYGLHFVEIAQDELSKVASRKGTAKVLS